MKSRKTLKELYQHKYLLELEISCMTEIYIEELDYKPGIYITDHALIRFLERVEGVKFTENISDSEKLKAHWECPEDIRARVLTIEDDRAILNNQLSIFQKEGISYIIKNLAIVSLFKKDK